MACGEVPGTQYVIEGVAKQEVATLQGVNRLGGHASENLGNLARLAGISMNIIHVPEGVTLDQVKALPGVRVVEGKFFHPFYDKGLLGGLIPSAPLKPTHLVASFVQLLPPHIFAGLPAQEWVSNLTNLSVSDSQALQPFSSKNYPFGVPGLTLGKKETKGEAATRGGMDEILDHLQVPAAWDSNQGENMIVGVIDSGVSPAQVPPENRAGGWSEHGEQNPWSDANGHGSMCAGIIQQVAPKSKIIALRPMVSADGNMSSLGTISALNYLAGKAQELKPTDHFEPRVGDLRGQEPHPPVFHRYCSCHPSLGRVGSGYDFMGGRQQPGTRRRSNHQWILHVYYSLVDVDRCFDPEP